MEGAGSIRQPDPEWVGMIYVSRRKPAISIFDAQADARRMDHVQAVDLVQGGMEIGLDGEMGHDDQRDRALLGGVVAGIVLDDAGDADPLARRGSGPAAPARRAGRRS